MNSWLLSVDNFLNSFQLIDQFSFRKIPIIGTLRPDRLKKVLISSKKEVLDKDRGYFEVIYRSSQGKKKAVVAWKDTEVKIA